ncbi:MAG: phosphonate monoester hydrolase [Alphaproteobacteria bacterium]|nr:phosphonate monoester hydrolase [Alphaproteobacteria bacterium]
MAKVRNILFIMCDQLRADYLGCAGHPHLKTPHIDALAAAGTRFERAYVQSAVCGPSRMSFYTGRYVASHGASWNRVPLSAAEWTLGDYLRPLGLRVALAGKTHVLPDAEGLERFGIEGGSALHALMSQGGFESLDRYDGHTPPGEESGYPAFLREQGYQSNDPWNDFVVATVAPDGTVASGWQMRNVRHPARIKEEHSETAYMTDRALGFVEDMGERPWCLHLSYVKPHWPYVAPAPYHALYGAEHLTPANRSAFEWIDPHPALAAYRRHDESLSFARDETLATVKPVYMGLIAQLDRHIGRLIERLKRLGRWEDTLIVLTADHGDFLGDHWLGEKELFYEEAWRVPMILRDPDPAADAGRGAVETRLVEGIDLIPTFLDALGGPPHRHRLEGRSLLALTRAGSKSGAKSDWREAVFGELDYGFRAARLALGRGVRECRAMAVRTERWKYVWWQGLRPQLYDLELDPQERGDLGTSPRHDRIRARMHARLFDWLATRKRRTTVSDDYVAQRTNRHRQHGIHIGIW